MAVPTHKHWNYGFASGASGEQGGHWKALGFTRIWTFPHGRADAPDTSWTFNLFGLLFVESRPGRGVRWALAGVKLEFRPARYRIFEAEQRRAQRHSRRRVAHILASIKSGHAD